MHTLTRVGAETINLQRVPVYALPTAAGRRFVEQRDPSGQTALISIEGARALKTGQFPLHPSLRTAASRLNAKKPFALRDNAEQQDETKKLLGAVVRRMIAVDTPFRVAAAA